MKLLDNARFLADWILGTVKEFGQDNASQLAASISYYVLFSIFPLLIFSVGIIGLVLQDEQLQADLVDEVMANIPLSQDQGRNDVASAIRNVGSSSSGAIGIVGLMTMAWSGSNMFGALRRSLNIALGAETPRPLLRQKLLDLAMVIVFAPFFLASLAATAALRLARRASGDIPVLGHLADDLGSLWILASFVLPVLISILAFGFLYRWIPARRPMTKYVLPGAIIAAILFEVVKVGFSIYLENFSNYDVVFGSLGAMVAFMFWIYLSANIMLFGAELIHVLPEALRKRHEPRLKVPKPPLSRRIFLLLRGLAFHPKEEEARSEGEQGESS